MYQKNPGSYVNLLIRKLSFFTLFIVTIITTAYAQTMQTSLVSVYTRVQTNVGGFLESLPNDYAANPTQKYPLLIAMHGVGESGNGAPGVLEKVANIAIPRRIKTGGFPASFTVGGKAFSFIVICPQMEDPNNWRGSIQAVIDYSKAHYRVDESRIYLTGLSLGGVWEWAFLGGSVASGQQLAAALMVTPGAEPTAAQLKNVAAAQLPIWVTNNTGDPYNNPAGATALVNAINSSVPAPPKALITIFEKSGHDAWTQTYDPAFKQGGLNVYEWMLTKTRGVAQAAPVTTVLTANAGPDQIFTLPVSTITLDASSSKVTSGSITSYAWAKVSGPTAGSLSLLSAGLQAKLTDVAAGTYVYQLTVKDSNGSTATDNVTVTVNAAPVSTDPPTANAGAGQSITLPVNSTTVDGAASIASSGNTIASYQWTKAATSPAGGDITSSASAKTTVSNLIAGTYTYNLTVTDNRGITNTASVNITVNATAASTDPPTALVASTMINLTLPLNEATLDGSSSVASAGNTIVSYKWTKYTGPSYSGIKTPTDAKITITKLVVGSYGFTLTVTDNNGKTSKKNVAVMVKAAPAARTAAEVTAATSDAALSVGNMPEVKAFEASVTPNPVQSTMNIRVNGGAAGKTSVLVYNLAGQLQLQQEFSKDVAAVNKQVNIAKLPPGMYIVQIIVDATHKQVLRIVKQ